MTHWEPTGKKATDAKTGAKLIEEKSTVSGWLRWAVYVDGELRGHVESYEGVVDKKAPGSRIVHSRKAKTFWAYQKVQLPDGPYQRREMRNSTRASAVYGLLNY